MLQRLLRAIGIRTTSRDKVIPTADEIESSLEELQRLGYLKFVEEASYEDVLAQLRSSLQKNCIEAEWDDECVSQCRRCFPADSENLSEGVIGKHITQMSAELAVEGVVFKEITDEFDCDRYTVHIDGEQFLIYDHEQLNDDTINLWAWSAKRLIEIVNELLERAGSAERLWGIDGGNDGRTMLLSTQLHAFISGLHFIAPFAQPYSASDALRR